MKQKDLARGLGVSEAMVSRLVRRGMPTRSVAEAQRWRAGNLATLRVDLRPAADSLAARVEKVRQLMALAAHDFDAHAEQLRAAMRMVPKHARLSVRLDFDVMHRLLPERLAQVLPPDPEGCRAQSREDAEAAGLAVYALCSGELRINP